MNANNLSGEAVKAQQKLLDAQATRTKVANEQSVAQKKLNGTDEYIEYAKETESTDSEGNTVTETIMEKVLNPEYQELKCALDQANDELDVAETKVTEAESEVSEAKKAEEESAEKEKNDDGDSDDKSDENNIKASITDEFNNAKDEQGIIGKIADGIKNLFHTGNCSNKIQKEINSLNKDSSEEDIQAVKDRINKYNSNQDSVVNAVASTGSMMAGGAIGAKAGAAIGTAIFPGIGTVGGVIIGGLIGAGAGALTNIGIHQIDNMTDKVKDNSWQNDKKILSEAKSGAISGGAGAVAGPLTQKITSTAASKLGLEAVNNAGKTAYVALGKDGTAKVGETVLKNATAGFLGSGTSAAAIADGSYIIDTVTDKDKEFSLNDLASTTATSFAVGGAIGATIGGVKGYKGVNDYNAILAKEAEKIIKPGSSALKTNVVEGYSKASDVEAYRFNPNGTPEEVLKNNPHVGYESETGKYYVQTSWGEKAYIDTSKEYLIAKYGEGDYNAIDGDIAKETYVVGKSFHVGGAREYIEPSTLEYGKATTITKQAPIKFIFAKTGTQYQSLEGVHELQPKSVIMIDSQGNPYQNTLENLLKRNDITGMTEEQVYQAYASANGYTKEGIDLVCYAAEKGYIDPDAAYEAVKNSGIYYKPEDLAKIARNFGVEQ